MALEESKQELSIHTEEDMSIKSSISQVRIAVVANIMLLSTGCTLAQGDSGEASNDERVDSVESDLAGTCGNFMYSEPCQTGGIGSESCSGCGGKTCYYRWEAT